MVNTNGKVNSTVKALMAFSTNFSTNKGYPRLMIRSLMVETAKNDLACREWLLLEVFLALGYGLKEREGGEGPRMSSRKSTPNS